MPGKTREEVDIQRITEWIRNPFRKPAHIAFTEGGERQIAYAVGDVLLPLLEKAVMAAQAQKLYDLGQEYKADAERLAEYIGHDSRCILSRRSAGRPTLGGGYEELYDGEWFQLRPFDKRPPCDCGLSEALSSHEKLLKGGA